MIAALAAVVGLAVLAFGFAIIALFEPAYEERERFGGDDQDPPPYSKDHKGKPFEGRK